MIELKQVDDSSAWINPTAISYFVALRGHTDQTTLYMNNGLKINVQHPPSDICSMLGSLAMVQYAEAEGLENK